ncbi:hypothetical protein GCM10023201_34400 [Actinomycetospora corticicola]
MGAHAARTSETGPTATTTGTAARLATTTLAVAVTGIIGSGTALAHDDGAGQHGGHGHHATSATSGDPADEARAEAQRTVRDTLADLGLPFSGTPDADSSDDEDSSSDDHDSPGPQDSWSDARADDVATAAHPSSGPPQPSVQPIAASSGTSQLPPVGQTRTVPIR